MKDQIEKLGRAKTVILLTTVVIIVAMALDMLLALVLNHTLTQPDDFIRVVLISAIITPFIGSFIFDLVRNIGVLKEDISKLATYDNLTGLFNRPVFNKASEKSHSYSIRNKQPYCIFAIKLDNFNQLNEKYGIDGGDRVISVFGQVVQDTVRDSDISTHFGGEHFALFLPNTDIDQAMTLSNRLREHILHKAVIHDGTKYIKYTISMGVALNPHNKAISFEKALKMADEALEAALTKGGNRVEVYSR